MRLAIAFLIAAALASCAAPGPITAVSVRDADFKVVKVLGPGELPEFTHLWENKQEVEGSMNNVGGQHFKLDIERPDSSGRWLYQTTGYVQLLSVQLKPVYKLQEPEAFNRLIGVKE